MKKLYLVFVQRDPNAGAGNGNLAFVAQFAKSEAQALEIVGQLPIIAEQGCTMVATNELSIWEIPLMLFHALKKPKQ